MVYRINSLAQGPPPVFRLHQLGAMSRPERHWILSHRRSLLRQTLVIQFRRERLELDGGPTAEESLALTTIERRQEYETFRLNEYGVIVLKGREVQLNRHDQTLSEKHRHEEGWKKSGFATGRSRCTPGAGIVRSMSETSIGTSGRARRSSTRTRAR